MEPTITDTQKDEFTVRKGSKLLPYPRASTGQKILNDFNDLKGQKSSSIPPLDRAREEQTSKVRRLEAIADWAGWCGEHMCKVFYFKRPLTRTQCMAFGLAYPAFTEGYYKPLNAFPFNQFHPENRVAARYIDQAGFHALPEIV